MSRPAGDDSSAGQLSRSRSISVSVEICGSEKSQVPPASQAYPSRHCVIWSADVGRFTSAMVLRFMLRSFGCYSGGKLIAFAIRLTKAAGRKLKEHPRAFWDRAP